MINRYKIPRNQRKIKVRKRLTARGNRPRLSVFRSNKHIFAQIIDDRLGQVLATASDLVDFKAASPVTKSQKAKAVGELIGQAAKKAKVDKVMFDRGGYKYHGRIKALAEAARKGGLKF